MTGCWTSSECMVQGDVKQRTELILSFDRRGDGWDASQPANRA